MSNQTERLANRLSPLAASTLLSAKLNGLVSEIRDGDPVGVGELEGEHHVIKRPGQWILSRSGHRVLEVLQARLARGEIEFSRIDQ